MYSCNRSNNQRGNYLPNANRTWSASNQRAREKAQSRQAMEGHLKRIKGDRMNAEGVALRTKRNQCTLGEISPGVDATNLDDALLKAREFARALSIPDVQESESL
jgi:hypothetical protein